MEPKDKAPSESQSHSSVQSNVRAKSDKAWDYATLHIEEDGKKHTFVTIVIRLFVVVG